MVTHISYKHVSPVSSQSIEISISCQRTVSRRTPPLPCLTYGDRRAGAGVRCNLPFYNLPFKVFVIGNMFDDKLCASLASGTVEFGEGRRVE